MPVLESLLGAVEAFGIRRGMHGNVVVIPGILGSDLTATDGGATENVWPLPPQIDKLLLDADGQHESQPGRVVRPTHINRIYFPLVQTLELFWNVLQFPYDWRKDIAETAKLLKQTVQEEFGNDSFHIVAHSMGGLIARRMLVANSGIQNGGRLVMLATPNYGSVLAETALESDRRAAEFLQLFGGSVQPVMALAAVRSWPSVYQLLPSPSRDAQSATFYSNPRPGLSAAHLAQAEELHRVLDAMPGDNSSMTYIGGTNIPTLDHDPWITFQGDGVVSRRLGVLDGIDTFMLTSDHLSLPAHWQVLGSITPLLRNGDPGFLR